MNSKMEDKNPFEEMKKIIVSNAELSLPHFSKEHSLTPLSAKSIWLTCPEFQERFCRRRISKSKDRGGNEYGNKNFLKRRYNLSEEELETIFRELWHNPKDKVSKAFLEIINIKRISENQLTKEAQAEIDNMLTEYNTKG